MAQPRWWPACKASASSQRLTEKDVPVLGVFDRAKEEGAIGRRDGRIQQHFAG